LSVANPPEKLPSHYLSVRISEGEAKKIIKHLAEADFLWRGTINREKRIQWPKSPFYTLYVEGEKGDAYFEHVTIEPKLVEQLKALSDVLDGEAAEAMKKLIQPLETKPGEKAE
jgi:hypothetical protein